MLLFFLTTNCCKDVRLNHSCFSVSSPDDDHLGSAKMIVCLPPTSLTRLSNAVDFLLQEEGETVANTVGTTFVPITERVCTQDVIINFEVIDTVVLCSLFCRHVPEHRLQGVGQTFPDCSKW